MKRSECWMSFSVALEEYLTAREVMSDAPPDSERYREAWQQMLEAADHMDALTGEES